ncbi:probable hexosyltransferase MUCI70 [Humulus lupulus]|uniref:probable hexosyltransferase MUCI70 n=1 Tax=Humulus lupulus TaxID=3486 RepID=UPI002B4080C9|nr:probable hexosyltransferase MUCI70 [Humulus lupulus]XP_062074234.1 probable hexosyltransferase MUCI70 [Humulus lupulus]XP_062074235.1 probable hexosyltransferase MUCI70 [Humulus lupulus]XP_062074236.1 probable hexosyltransferase MUCI70 [Humulus lupulus]XP_062074237.1 probable hexosyltransferase MUCI70 [Humulus lupulus]XP_062074238.1 probable hexosyltransferase MUCI70 [Humulus lupulus]XP_062074239.1 probable hexosyltransferase MUCI70 [Humulus lupulus]XP_062074240.1 probable hexosyltransfer
MNCYLEKRGIANENGIRVVRRGKRFGRFTFPRHKLSTWAFLFGATFLFYFVVFGLKMPFHEKLEDSPLIRQQTHRDLWASEAGRSPLTPPPPPPPPPPTPPPRTPPPPPPLRSKRRRQHSPCEIGFAKSVGYLVEPSNVTNFTQFSLEYIDQEENSRNNFFEPRFGGHQTLAERQQSFYAKNQTLHCGFVKGPPGYPSTGFEINEKDKGYMKTCKIVVSSCIFGNSDFLRRPTSKQISGYSKANVCFVMFVDEQTLSKLSLEGNVPDDGGKIGLWRIVVVRNLPYKDMRRTGKVPKLLSHRLFPSARYSIWLDSKMRLHTDPMLILEYFLWRTKSEYAISNHYDRHCVWEEVLQNKRLNKYNHTAIDEQFNFYQSDGLTKFDSSDPNKLLPSYVPEGSFIVRAHTPMSNLFSCLWFNEVDRFTSRDQLSFAYTYLKLKRTNPDKSFYLNMFKDCERRTLAKLFRHRILGLPSP